MRDRCTHALTMAFERRPGIKTLVVGGGVAANLYFREQLSLCTLKRGVTVVAPPISLCTDNGAMIAWAGIERLEKGLEDPKLCPSPSMGLRGSLNFAPRPRWP